LLISGIPAFESMTDSDLTSVAPTSQKRIANRQGGVAHGGGAWSVRTALR
jgi:hypothetical protein